MKKRSIVLGIFIFLIAQVLFAAPQRTIRFATEATYPPFEFKSDRGVITGFDIEIATALCKQMDAQCTFTNQSFSSLIPGLQLGKFDALIAALGITAERQQEVAFTNSYYQPSASFVGPIVKHYSLADIKGKTIGVQQGSTFEKYLKEKYSKNVIIKSYASIQDAFLDLLAERVDFVIADTSIAEIWLKQDNNNQKFTLIGSPIINTEYFGTGYGIAVRKDNVELLSAFNKALNEIKQNGEYEKIIKEYFGNIKKY